MVGLRAIQWIFLTLVQSPILNLAEHLIQTRSRMPHDAGMCPLVHHDKEVRSTVWIVFLFLGFCLFGCIYCPSRK